VIAAILLAAAIPSIFTSEHPSNAGDLIKAGIKRVYVPAANVGQWRSSGLEALPDSELNTYTKVPPPGMKMRADVGAATSIPWVDSNGWRYRRGVTRAYYATLPPGSAPLAAAEAYAYGVEAVLASDRADTTVLGNMLRFLQSIPPAQLPPMANIGVIDDGSPLLGEVLNLLTRRNLLYRIVKEKDPKLDLIVELGTEQFPKASAANPSDFAARVREKLSDEKRLLRVYNTSTVIGYLTGDGSRARLHLLNYARRPAKDVHIRIRDAYSKVRLQDSTDAQMQAMDISKHRGGTEFRIPSLQTYSIVDLEK
jgi:hypothetical protein